MATKFQLDQAALGDSFTILNFASSTGSFATVSQPSGLPIRTYYNSTNVTLVVSYPYVITTADSGPGSLREAILEADALTFPTSIVFDIPMNDTGYSGGIWTIQPLSALPAITNAVTLDGTTQPGFQSTPVIRLDGALAGSGTGGPAPDVQAPLMSLPRILGTTVASIPGITPYLFADGALRERWRQKIGPGKSLKVGLCWRGNPQYSGDRYRSIPLKQLRPLSEIPGVQLFSLQKGKGAEQLAELAGEWPITDLGT